MYQLHTYFYLLNVYIQFKEYFCIFLFFYVYIGDAENNGTPVKRKHCAHFLLYYNIIIIIIIIILQDLSQLPH